MKKTEFKDVETLSCAAIDVKPIDFDFSNAVLRDTWELHEASECETCGVALFVGGNGDKHCNLDDDSKCEGHVPQTEGPMMNFAYPLPDAGLDFECTAIELVNLPLCVVVFEDGDAFLALTGGGMDLSWEICEAYMRLGYLPPIHFELPGMAGRGASAKDKWIVAGYLRACEVAEGWAKRKADCVRSLVKQAKRRTA